MARPQNPEKSSSSSSRDKDLGAIIEKSKANIAATAPKRGRGRPKGSYKVRDRNADDTSPEEPKQKTENPGTQEQVEAPKIERAQIVAMLASLFKSGSNRFARSAGCGQLALDDDEANALGETWTTVMDYYMPELDPKSVALGSAVFVTGSIALAKRDIYEAHLLEIQKSRAVELQNDRST